MKLTPWDPDLKSIVSRINAGDLDLQPDFQRQEVWTTVKKKKLVDTILRGWSIPPVHLVVRADGLLEVLDGQQRLAAIRDFFDNVFAIDGHITPEEPKALRLDGKRYRDLLPADRRSIDQYSLRCFRLEDYRPDEPSELFYRLNQPTMLTAGEQRNALFGRPREQLKELVSAFENGGNQKATIGFSNARLAYDDVFARLLFFLERKSFALKSTEVAITERFRKNEAFSSAVVGQASRSVYIFTRVRESSDKWHFNKASLLSMLLFLTRFNEDHLSLIPFFKKFFIDGEILDKDETFTSSALRIFRDRASLRVTDVSSVVFRDFAMWYCYYFWASAPIPRGVNEFYFLDISKACKDNSASFESVLNNRLSIEDWGTLP